MKAHVGLMYFRHSDDKVFFVGVMDKPDHFMTDEETRPFVLVPCYRQIGMMLIDPPRHESLIEGEGHSADSILTQGKWKSNTMDFDKLPPKIREIIYPMIAKSPDGHYQKDLKIPEE